jgi:hypothetical protein
MRKPLIMTLLLAMFATANTFAQTTHRDSVTKIAQTDAKKLELSKEDKERFKHDKDNYSSDLFKPTEGVASDSKLLQDSIYVKAFRAAAYKRAHDKKSAGHYVLLGLGGYVVISAIVIVVATIVIFSGLK